MINHHPVEVRVKLISNRTTITVGRALLAHVSKKQSVKDQAIVKLKAGFLKTGSSLSRS